MTYQELKKFVNSLSDADMTKDVQVLLIDAGEFTSLDYAAFADETDALEFGTPYLMA